MTRLVVTLAAATLLVACSVHPSTPPVDPSFSPAPSATPNVLPTAPAPPTARPVAPGAPELGLAVVHEFSDQIAGEMRFDDLRVELIRLDGGRETIELPDVHPEGWIGTGPHLFPGYALGPTGWLMFRQAAFEAPGGIREGTVAAELDRPERPAQLLGKPSASFAWGPDGSLWAEASEIRNLDLGTAIEVSLPAGVQVDGWAADGSRLVGSRLLGRGQVEPGSLDVDGRWTPGRVRAFETTGLERPYSAAGGVWSDVVVDCFESCDSLTEARSSGRDIPDLVDWWFWMGDEPHHQSAVWDAEGTGVWVTLAAQDGRRWLSHITEPMVDAPVADLPPDVDWHLVGISFDDRLVVLESGATQLLLVDTESGTGTVVARRVAGADDGPYFAGWLR